MEYEEKYIRTEEDTREESLFSYILFYYLGRRESSVAYWKYIARVRNVLTDERD